MFVIYYAAAWFAFGKGYLVHGLLFSISVAVKLTI